MILSAFSSLNWTETHTGPITEEKYIRERPTGREILLSASKYLKNRPLKILRLVLNNDGFEV